MRGPMGGPMGGYGAVPMYTMPGRVPQMMGGRGYPGSMPPQMIGGRGYPGAMPYGGMMPAQPGRGGRGPQGRGPAGRMGPGGRGPMQGGRGPYGGPQGRGPPIKFSQVSISTHLSIFIICIIVIVTPITSAVQSHIHSKHAMPCHPKDRDLNKADLHHLNKVGLPLLMHLLS